MDRRDAHLYRKLATLARKQLESIDRRISSKGPPASLDKLLFRYRHERIRNILSGMLTRREARLGEVAVLELIEEFKHIAADEGEWSDVDEKETDYLRFILHGIRSAPQRDDAEDGEG